jgi:tetratricopeptide (TPR) repeat protein
LGWIVLLLAIPSRAQEAHMHPGSGPMKPPTSVANRFGSVQFDNSCAPAVQADFNNAVAILHSFEYDEARDAFAKVAREDPTCAMAQWGEAMASFHGLWSEFNATEGSRAAAAARKIAAENPSITPREKQFIAAISEIFSDQAIKQSQRPDNLPDSQGYSRPDNDAETKYTARMADLHTQFPEDREATIFYALALAITARSSDKTHADLHRCTTLLNPLLVEIPNHPGVAHYLIHCNDNPEMAADGLVAARKYAQIAPASAHATHMPAHIFAQLGLWNEMVNSNRIAIRAADQDTHASPCEKVGNTLHAMSYLVVGLAETGQMTEARNVVERALPFKSTVPGAAQCPRTANDVLVSYMLETSEWRWTKNLVPDPADWTYWYVVGIAAARTGDTVRAAEAEQTLIALRDHQAANPGGSAQNQAEVFRLAIAGWRAQQAGKRADAVHDLQQAAALQDRLGTSFVTLKPVREMLADVLLSNGNTAQALTEYKAVLAQKPNRFDSLYGAGSAAYAQGDTDAARAYYTQLLAIAKGDQRPELVIARSRTSETVPNVAASTRP